MDSAWIVTVLDDGTLCVYPKHDVRPHTINDCWCGSYYEDGVLIHNSMDRREEYERGRLAS
jgi:hypothetical protein